VLVLPQVDQTATVTQARERKTMISLPPEFDDQPDDVRAIVEGAVMRYLPLILLDKRVMDLICAWQVLECDVVGAYTGLTYEDWLQTRDGDGK
jgi:hypothetical protein